MTPESNQRFEEEELSELCQTHRDVLVAIQRELQYQRQKWGADKPHSLPGFLVVMESELAEAKQGWMKNIEGRNSPLSEVVQIAAVAIACLSRSGTSGSAVSTCDISVAEITEMKLRASEKRWGNP